MIFIIWRLDRVNPGHNDISENSRNQHSLTPSHFFATWRVIWSSPQTLETPRLPIWARLQGVKSSEISSTCCFWYIGSSTLSISIMKSQWSLGICLNCFVIPKRLGGFVSQYYERREKIYLDHVSLDCSFSFLQSILLTNTRSFSLLQFQDIDCLSL